MAAAHFLKTRVSPETKQLARAAAQHRLLTESIWLRQRVLDALRAGPGGRPTPPIPSQEGRNAGDRDRRLYVRTSRDDRLLLDERAAARGMAPATYVSLLLRAHLRRLQPLPKEELMALKRSVAELGAIGRNLNQLARAANSKGEFVGPPREELRALIRVCEALRDNVKGLIKTNVRSWELGYVEAQSPSERRRTTS